jgi:hypothetical protein
MSQYSVLSQARRGTAHTSTVEASNRHRPALAGLILAPDLIRLANAAWDDTSVSSTKFTVQLCRLILTWLGQGL